MVVEPRTVAAIAQYHLDCLRVAQMQQSCPNLHSWRTWDQKGDLDIQGFIHNPGRHEQGFLFAPKHLVTVRLRDSDGRVIGYLATVQKPLQTTCT